MIEYKEDRVFITCDFCKNELVYFNTETYYEKNNGISVSLKIKCPSCFYCDPQIAKAEIIDDVTIGARM
jgi:ribosomal protein S27E